MSEYQNNDSESSLLYFIKTILSNWKLLVSIYAIVGVLTVIILLLLPKWYKSDATIVILEDNQSPLTGLMTQFNAFGLSLSGQGNVETYIEFVHTNKMYDRLIQEFGLGEVYDTKFTEDTYDAIFENLEVSNNENNTFTISYLYKEDPRKAADIVRFIYKELDNISLEVDRAEASNFRTYIENYYNKIQADLIADEDSLTSFQNTTGILDLEKQIEVTVEGLAELEKQKISLEIERNYLSSIFDNSNRLKEINTRIDAVQNRLDNLRTDQNTTLVALDGLPEKGAQFLRLKRDILIGEKVAEFLRLQYEQALLDEQKINSNLYLVDPPVVPEKKFKPQRARILLVVMFFTVILSLIYLRANAFYDDHRHSLKKLL